MTTTRRSSRLRRATADECHSYMPDSPEGRPLYGFVSISGHDCPVEILPRGDSARFEIRAPRGFLFDGDLSGLVCFDVADLRERSAHAQLELDEGSEESEKEDGTGELRPDAGFWTVAPFHVSREYGGPEEGGWWYDAGEPLAGPEFPLPVVTKSIEEAQQAETAMQAALDELNKAHGNRPRYSVLSSGEYEARIVDGYPEPFPQERPTYC